MGALAPWSAVRGIQRWALTCFVLALASCTAELKERCRYVTQHTRAPALPPGFAQVDGLIIRRAIAMTKTARELRGSLAVSFRIYYAEESLPLLCGKLDQARELALAGRAREAGLKYQALLLAMQVFELTIAMHAFSEYADASKVVSPRITQMQELYARQIGPLLDAALSEDPARIERALAQHGGEYGAWAESLGRWSSQVEAQEPRLRVAEAVWNVLMLVIATHEAATAAAELAAGRAPPPPLPAFAAAGGAGAVAMSPAATLELAEVLRKLIALGALDAGVVAGLSHLGAGKPGAIPPDLDVPTSLQMSSVTDAAPVRVAGEPGPLRQVGPRTWQSSGGLVYGPGGAEGDRVLHVLEHTADIPGRPGAHGVFAGGQRGVFGIIDEAYGLARAGAPGASVVQQGSRTIYTVHMGKPVGFIGGQAGAAMGNPTTTYVRLVLEGKNVITAYPVIP